MKYSAKCPGHSNIRHLFVALGLVFVLGAAADPPLSYTLTLYVDEGHDSLSGHVFAELSDGKNRLYLGFYPKEAWTDEFSRVIALPGIIAGGEVRDDIRHRWDVRKTFLITQDGFKRAVETAELGRSKNWCPLNHCGDFALGVAAAAGIKLDLPHTVTGTDRPELFGAYLRQNGGVTSKQIEDCEDDVRLRTTAGEVKIDGCEPCSTAQKQENLTTLHRLRDQKIKACDATGR